MTVEKCCLVRVVRVFGEVVGCRRGETEAKSIKNNVDDGRIQCIDSAATATADKQCLA